MRTLLKGIPARVTFVAGPDVRQSDAFGNREDFGNYVEVSDKFGERYIFVNTAPNAVSRASRKVGTRGVIRPFRNTILKQFLPTKGSA